MQPPAEVEPARISQVEQPFSRRDMSRMSAALAVSRDENDILRIESMIGRASNLVMSTCSTVLASSSAFAFLRCLATAFTGAAFAFEAVLVAMGGTPEDKDVRGRRPAQSGFGGGYSSVRLRLKDKSRPFGSGLDLIHRLPACGEGPRGETRPRMAVLTPTCGRQPRP